MYEIMKCMIKVYNLTGMKKTLTFKKGQWSSFHTEMSIVRNQ